MWNKGFCFFSHADAAWNDNRTIKLDIDTCEKRRSEIYLGLDKHQHWGGVLIRNSLSHSIIPLSEIVCVLSTHAHQRDLFFCRWWSLSKVSRLPFLTIHNFSGVFFFLALIMETKLVSLNRHMCLTLQNLS